MPLLLPERMEAGTLPTPSIASLSAGIDFILQNGIENIEQKVRKLTDQLGRELQAIQGVSVVDRVGHGIVSFRTEAQTPERLAMLLDEAGICVRAGLQCAPLAHATFGTGETGAVRMSVSYLTTEEELAYALRALFSVLRMS